MWCCSSSQLSIRKLYFMVNEFTFISRLSLFFKCCSFLSRRQLLDERREKKSIPRKESNTRNYQKRLFFFSCIFKKKASLKKHFNFFLTRKSWFHAVLVCLVVLLSPCSIFCVSFCSAKQHGQSTWLILPGFNCYDVCQILKSWRVGSKFWNWPRFLYLV